MGPDLALALDLADLADPISLAHFRSAELIVDAKPDRSPVTQADREVERRLREELAVRRPDEPVLGEEEGGGADAAAVRWIVDPIDGTRNFSRGVPVWATLIALERRGEVVAGVVSAPALGRRWWAERGGGAWADGVPARVSAVARVEDAHLLFALDRPLPDLAARAWHVRGFGDFWAHMLVAEGAADAAVDAVGVSVWDLAAVQVVVEEAGGRFSDAAGRRRIDGGTAVSSNGFLHDAALAAAATGAG